MPLIKNILEIKLREIFDKEYINFSGFPENNIDVANVWADAIDSYANSLIPISTTTTQAKAAFKLAMLPISSSAQNGLIQLTSAFTAYASALALGMQPTFTGIPPAVPINISSIIPIGLGGASGEVVAKMLANIIHLWFKTGTATNNSSGATINWN